MSAASNSRHCADKWRWFSFVCRDLELNQGVRWQVSRAEFDKNAAKANVSYIPNDCFPPRIFNANVLAG